MYILCMSFPMSFPFDLHHVDCVSQCTFSGLRYRVLQRMQTAIARNNFTQRALTPIRKYFAPSPPRYEGTLSGALCLFLLGGVGGVAVRLGLVGGGL